MSKSSTAREFRKVDVDKFDEDRFQDDQAEEDQTSGPNENEVNQLLMSYPFHYKQHGRAVGLRQKSLSLSFAGSLYAKFPKAVVEYIVCSPCKTA